MRVGVTTHVDNITAEIKLLYFGKTDVQTRNINM